MDLFIKRDFIVRNGEYCVLASDAEAAARPYHITILSKTSRNMESQHKGTCKVQVLHLFSWIFAQQINYWAHSELFFKYILLQLPTSFSSQSHIKPERLIAAASVRGRDPQIIFLLLFICFTKQYNIPPPLGNSIWSHNFIQNISQP